MAETRLGRTRLHSTSDEDDDLGCWWKIKVIIFRSYLWSDLLSTSLFSGSNFLLMFEMFLVGQSEIRDDETSLHALLKLCSHPLSHAGRPVPFSVSFIRILRYRD